jgi:hypothetical protein
LTEHTPVFAILGHPNEGKSSVVATLAEDDSVRISPTPGETRKCREYPVTIDGTEIIRFIDTPGFQQPRRTLAWMQQFEGPEADRIPEFIRAHRNDPDFRDECELLRPVADGAGIIFVTDGTRPLRQTDRVEMEILRLTGLPRMAIINPKEKTDLSYLEDWKAGARKHFNTIRIFDAQRATYAERIELLESLKMIDPDWQAALTYVIDAFKQDWAQRMAETANIITGLVENAAGHSVKKTCRDAEQVGRVRQELAERYQADIQKMEQAAHKQIRKRFKHNIFNLELPPQSILNEYLFASRTWKILGLNRWQLATAAGAGGGIIGANIDLALAGLSFGVFTALGGAIGAGSAVFGADRMAKAKIRGLPVGRVKIRVGPAQNDQLLFVLIDRALIYFSHVINWAHSRRDQPQPGVNTAAMEKSGYTSAWSASFNQTCRRFLRAVRKGHTQRTETLKPEIIAAVTEQLNDISKH